MAQAVTTAREAISAAKREPTNANIVEALERLYDGPDGLAGLKSDVATLKGHVSGLSDDMAVLKSDVGKLLHYFGLTSGSTP